MRIRAKKMNVLQIVSSLAEISGPARSLYLCARGMKERGHHVVCAHFIGGDGPLVAQLRALGIPVINLSEKPVNMPRLHRLRILLRLVKLVYAQKIQIIHAHHWDADCYAFEAAMFKKMKVIVTLHSRSYISWVKQQCRKYQKLFIPRVTRFVCVSGSLRPEFSGACAIPGAKISVIHNSPSPEFFDMPDTRKREALREEFGVSSREFLIGTVGNFSAFKGISFLLESLKPLKGDFKLMLVGANYQTQKSEFMEFIRQNNLSDKVIFAGFRQDIPDILDALDLFVFPSTEELDPIALSEAMAKGKPVLATRVGGIPEKITDQRSGLLVPPADAAALSAAIQHCMDNPKQMADIAKAAREAIRLEFSFGTMIDKYEEIYLS